MKVLNMSGNKLKIVNKIHLLLSHSLNQNVHYAMSMKNSMESTE